MKKVPLSSSRKNKKSRSMEPVAMALKKQTPLLDMIRAMPVALQRKSVLNIKDIPLHKLKRRPERDSEKSYLNSSLIESSNEKFDSNSIKINTKEQ